MDNWKPNWVDKFKIPKTCGRCGKKMYGQTFMSAEGMWHKGRRCWNCKLSNDVPWDVENWCKVPESVIVIVREDWFIRGSGKSEPLL